VDTRKKRGALHYMYHTAPGRLLLKTAAGRGVSRVCGAYLDSPLSRWLIAPFVKKHAVPLEDYLPARFGSFNEFFTRRIRPELRPIPSEPEALIAPCDGRLSAYRITEGAVIPIKQSAYTVSDLLGGDAAAARYADGTCLVFRLCVDDYHRYCFPDAGRRLGGAFLPGELHTVRPVALERLPVFVRNCREYTVMETEHFGTVTQVEVGAMLVGRIFNHPDRDRFVRGEEKGMFLYGGSTVVLLLEKDRAELPEVLFADTDRGWETPVRMGQILGRAAVACGAGEVRADQRIS